MKKRGQKVKLDLEKALKMVETEYECAKKLNFVFNPLAYALYQVWKIADKQKGGEGECDIDNHDTWYGCPICEKYELKGR